MHCFLYVLFVILTTTAFPTDLPDPSDFALILSDDDFEKYLEAWLHQKYQKVTQISRRSGGCTLKVNGDLGQPQPVYIHENNYLTPSGNTGEIHLKKGDNVIIACTGSGRKINHPRISASVNIIIARCEKTAYVSGEGWLHGKGAFVNITCSTHSDHEAVPTSDSCFNNNLVIRVGYKVNNIFYPLYWSCFDPNRLEVLYVWFELNPQNAVNQLNVERPGWRAGKFFPGIDVNNLYTKAKQKLTISEYVGSTLADKYVTNVQYLARGHLAAKTDFIYATGQRATFYFINSAPQWQSFNNGNWNSLEQNLRTRIGNAGYSTIVYTGTYGVLQLRNSEDNLADIYLNPDRNNQQLPVPMYYYKVVYDPSRNLGTAFIGINNPYLTLNEARELQFCKDQCRNNKAFDWLRWKPDRVEIGYSFCCTIQDFRNYVPHLPVFTVKDLLS